MVMPSFGIVRGRRGWPARRSGCCRRGRRGPWSRPRWSVWRAHLLVQCLPEILVDHRLLGRRHPALALPAVNPGGDAVLQVLGIGDHFHLAGFVQRAQAFDGGAQLHAVVGGVRLAIPTFPSCAVVAQNAGPAARAGVAQAGAIGDEMDFLHRIRKPPPAEAGRIRPPDRGSPRAVGRGRWTREAARRGARRG